MTTYTFKPSRIASLIELVVDGRVFSLIYMSKEHGVIVGLGGTPLSQLDWPQQVIDEIQRHFETVFNLRHEDWTEPGPSPRAVYVDQLSPWTLEV